MSGKQSASPACNRSTDHGDAPTCSLRGPRVVDTAPAAHHSCALTTACTSVRTLTRRARAAMKPTHAFEHLEDAGIEVDWVDEVCPGRNE